MASTGWNGFKFKLAVPKKQRVSSCRKRQTKLICGTVIEENETFRVEVDLVNNGVSCTKILNFTPESFELKDRLSVFTIKKDKKCCRTRIIRDAWHAKFHPGLTEQYVPFANNWIVKGYVVKEGVQLLFDFKELIGINGYVIINDECET